jgi:hypothetical protein
VVILEDASVDLYMAVGQRRGTYFPPVVSEGESSGDEKLIWVEVRAVLRPETTLLVSETDYKTGLKCRTLGEAYKAKCGV